MLACLLLASSCARSAAPVAPDSLPKPDGGAMMETVKALASTDNARVAGTEGEEGAAAYLAERFRSLGLEVSIDEFPILAFRTTSASLGLGSGTTLRADALLYSPPTPKAGLDAALVYCGYGFPEDFASAHAKGAIVLVLRGRAWLREKAANAAAAGALGLVVFDPERTEFQGTLLAPASIPCAAIGGAEGRALQGRLEAGERIRAHFVVDSSIENGKSRNLIARLPGSRGGKPVLVGAHLDSVFTPGALDDASGLACLLELARVLAAQAGRAGPARSDIYFVCFGAEELGDLGSTRFVRTYRGPELGGMLELDTVGSGSTTMVYTRRGDSNAVAKAALAAAAAIGARAEAGASEGSDHVPFAEAGIPAAFLMREPETRYHSDADQVSAVSEDALVETLRIAAATTLGLAR